MKSKLLLVFSAVMALVIVVGCSNGSRTTAPANEFNLPSDHNGLNRFDNATPPVIQSGDGGFPISEIGRYYVGKESCEFVQLKDEFYELSFETHTPRQLQNGDMVLVKGLLFHRPGERCRLASTIIVESCRVLANSEVHPNDQDGF
jgi:hypothetical protein